MRQAGKERDHAKEQNHVDEGARRSSPAGARRALRLFRRLDGGGRYADLGCTLDETFVLSGSGTLSVDTCEGDFRLAADNSAFTGAFSFLKTRVYVDHVRALGIRNKVTASYGSEWPRGSAAYFRVNASGTFENDLSIDGGTGFWAYAVVGDHQVVQAGKVTCLNTTASPCPRFEALGGSALVFTGGIVGASGATAGRAVFNGNVTLAGAYTNDSVRCAFCGAAGLTFAGSGRMRFTKWTSTTAGRLEVRSGELALDADGGWGGTNAVVAVSGGTLTVTATAARTAFGGADSRVSLELSGTGLIDVTDGCVVDVGRMCVNGVPASAGEYGGVNAEGKKRFAAWFGAGRGLVRVRRGSSLVIVVR